MSRPHLSGPETARALPALALTLLAGTTATAQQAAPTAPPTRRIEARVPMRDGIVLATDVYLPPGEGPFPTLFTPTPYDSRQDPDATFERRLAARGYAFVLLNVRGCFGSEGEFAPFLHETPDHEDSLAWILEQPWCNGRVGLVGSSSQSYSNQWLATTGHEALGAMVNISGLCDTQEVFFPGGAFRLDTLYPWLQFFYLRQPIRSMTEWDRRFRHRPMRENFAWGVELMRDMASRRIPAERIRVPTLHVTGWNDVVYRQTLYLRRTIPADVPQQLVVGPWMHNQIGTSSASAGDEDYAPDGILDDAGLADLLGRWFDRHLRDADVDTGPPVRVWIFGHGWRDFASWPTSTPA